MPLAPISLTLSRHFSLSFIASGSVIYSHMQIHIYIYTQHHNDTIIKDERRLLYKYIPLTLFVRVRKGYSRFACERDLETEQKLQYSDPHSHGRQRCVFLVLLMLNRRPWGPLCLVLAFFTASYQQLLWSPNSIGILEGPLGRVWLSLPHLVYLRL